jgi:hypothetical protein
VTSARMISVATGVLFIVATVAALAADVVGPVLTGPDHLAVVANDPTQLATAVLLYLIAAGTSVGIAIALYPMLKQVNAALALGSVVFRTIEAVFYAVAALSLLSILSLATAAADDSQIADSFVGIRDHANVIAVFAFSTGALMYYKLLYQSQLIPRWLSGWGIFAALLMAIACLLALFNNSPVTGYAPFILPILAQEMALAVWLLVKGFSPSALASQASFES